MSEVFKVKKGSYNSHNKYWHSFSIIHEISKLSLENKQILEPKIDKIYKEYKILSNQYQQNKNLNQIPLK